MGRQIDVTCRPPAARAGLARHRPGMASAGSGDGAQAAAAAFLERMLADPSASPLATRAGAQQQGAAIATDAAAATQSAASGTGRFPSSIRPKVMIVQGTVVHEGKKGHGDYEVQTRIEGDEMTCWIRHKRCGLS
eukprot:SAG31_NODE_8862_length_1372_cov_1.448547_1_plen_135_part_00